ncbi:sodium/calcium exchanger protein [Phlyctema vagabunda]|uniref:Sodium/calcium exchanger protein n=1 Tax=Phlyctema vagabunda TaxID=108571 RepID=A0ABR4PK55_9HELO
MQNAQPFAFVLLALWLALLFSTIGIAASDFFCINLSTIASILGMSESMAGVTFLAFGNGSPDVFSTFAAMNSHSGSLAIGELIGAACFITSVVAGSMALVREFKVGKKTFVRDVGFFIVAASFSMIFLADGNLLLWECCAMIGFYVFYVITVVVWHWYLGRRRTRREREAAARGHYLTPGNEEIEVAEEDDDDEDAPAGERYRDEEDFEALERGASPAFGSQVGNDSDDDGDAGMHLAAEMASSMRVTRPRGLRRNTITPIRPSLVGALEFRSVLSSLQKSRGSHTRPIHLRRYSDDPTAMLNQYDGPSSEPAALSEYASSVIVTPADAVEEDPTPGPLSRARAGSMNDVQGTKAPDPAAFSVANVPNIGVVAATPTFPPYLDITSSNSGLGSNSNADSVPVSPTFSISPAPSTIHSRSSSPVRTHQRQRSNHGPTLVPPEEAYPGAPRHFRGDSSHQERNDSPAAPPRSKPVRPQLQIPGDSRTSSRSGSPSPIIQFPAYTDSPFPMSGQSSPRVPSLLLPDATMASDSMYTSIEPSDGERPIRWWPYQVLPSPYVIKSSLFPTLCTWREKTIWDKFISVISAPSIFFLAITLPVVESDSTDDGPQEHDLEDDIRDPTSRDRRRSTAPLLTPDSPSLLANMEPEWLQYRRSTISSERRLSGSHSPTHRGLSGHNGSAGVAASIEDHHHHSDTHLPSKAHSVTRVDATSIEPARDWNRWLVAVQIFTGPLFVVTIIWANTAEGSHATRALVHLVLYSLLGSLIVFGILLLTTTPDKPPKYRFILCFVGFVVAIAWISTIANEVVGVLKAFGVILGISDAILGLTIFAVGNSLGDLVADVTVARLGYPVMALSACFGGPMLNILLGVGISGVYMTLKEANHRHAKHPGKKYHYKPFQIEVSGTLMISAITLIVTLVGLLIAVPLNKWVMSRRIGWGLIILWSISTVINLAVEISGVWGDTASH